MVVIFKEIQKIKYFCIFKTNFFFCWFPSKEGVVLLKYASRFFKGPIITVLSKSYKAQDDKTFQGKDKTFNRKAKLRPSGQDKNLTDPGSS